MEFSLLSSIILIILIPFILILLGTIYFFIYSYLTNAHKDVQKKWKSFDYFYELKKDLFFIGQKSSLLNIILLINLSFGIFLTYLVSSLFGYGFEFIKFDIFLIFICIVLPLILSGIYYSSKELYSSSKE